GRCATLALEGPSWDRGPTPCHLSARVGDDLVEDRHSSALKVAPEPLPSQRVERDRPELVEDEVADRTRRREIAHDASTANQRLEQGLPGAAARRTLPGRDDDGLARAVAPTGVLGARPLAAP